MFLRGEWKVRLGVSISLYTLGEAQVTCQLARASQEKTLAPAPRKVSRCHELSCAYPCPHPFVLAISAPIDSAAPSDGLRAAASRAHWSSMFCWSLRPKPIRNRGPERTSQEKSQVRQSIRLERRTSIISEADLEKVRWDAGQEDVEVSEPYRRIIEEAKRCIGFGAARGSFPEEWDAQLLVDCGATAEGQRIVLFTPGFLQPILNDADELDRAFHFLLLHMDEMAMQKKYVFVYCCLGMDWSAPLLAERLQIAFEILPRKYTKNLKRFYVLHATSSTHVTMWSFYAWLTPQFWDKIQFVNSIETICEDLHPNDESSQVELRRRFPQVIQRQDALRNGDDPPVNFGVPIRIAFWRSKVKIAVLLCQESAPRTLFATHLDAFTTESQIRQCFSSFGPVEKVELKCVEKRAPKAEQRADHVRLHVVFARVVFKEVHVLRKALDAATGLISAHTDPARLRQEIDDWMAQYDEREEEKKRLAKETQVDDDGFTKVVSGITRTPDGLTIRGARRPSLKTGAFGESTEQTAAPTGKKMKSKKSKEMPDFYRFQLREKRRDELIDHRKRNRKDLETVKQMKKAKRFKATAICNTFGVDFTDKTTGRWYPKLPPAVIFLCEALEREAADEEFGKLFEVDPDAVFPLLNTIDYGNPLPRDLDPALLWCCLKVWLDCLPSPLLSFEAMNLLQSREIQPGNIQMQREYLIEIFHEKLPEEVAYVALYISSFLHTMCNVAQDRWGGKAAGSSAPASAPVMLTPTTAAKVFASGFLRPRAFNGESMKAVPAAESLIATLIEAAEEKDLWIGGEAQDFAKETADTDSDAESP
eukprot:s262_g8.t3